MHICKRIHQIGGENIKYGDTEGICRITGEKGIGVPFNKWVKKTFNDWAYLKPGDIISNEAMFCFDEKSEIIQRKTGREKLQRFRTYSHIIHKGNWYCVTKADKRKIAEFIISGAELVCLTETGQKHILFKHRDGFWQLDELYIKPDTKLFKLLHGNMCELLNLKFSQKEIITGAYISARIVKAGVENWKKHEEIIKHHRGSGFFDFVSFLLYKTEKEK